MQHVFNNAMCAHVWAQRTQPHGRSNNGNMYFDGATLYSYGSHFALGHIMPDGATLLNSDSYSVSTNRHQSCAWSAVSGEYFRIPALTVLLQALRPINSLGKAQRRAMREYVLEHGRALSDDAIRYLLNIVGLSGSRKKIFDQIAVNERKAARLAIRREKNRLANLIKEIASFSFPEFTAYVTLKRNSNSYDPLMDLERLSKKMFHAHRYANQTCSKRRTALIWTRLIYVRKIIANLKAMAARNSSRRYVRAMIATIRKSRAATNGLDMERNAAAFAVQADLANLAGANAPIPKALRDTLYARSLFLQPYVDAHRDYMQKEILRKNERDIKDWREGGTRIWLPHTLDCMLRIKGDTVETSQHATFPTDHAIKAWPLIKACRDKAREFKPNGRAIKLGHFHIDAIAPNGDVKAGCHFIRFAEIERAAAALGLI